MSVFIPKGGCQWTHQLAQWQAFERNQLKPDRLELPAATQNASSAPVAFGTARRLRWPESGSTSQI